MALSGIRTIYISSRVIFLKKILNMMVVKVNIACTMCCIQNSMEFGGMNSITLPDQDDLYIIGCEMACRLRAPSYLVYSICYSILTKNGIVTTSVKHGLFNIVKSHFSCRF